MSTLRPRPRYRTRPHRKPHPKPQRVCEACGTPQGGPYSLWGCEGCGRMCCSSCFDSTHTLVCRECTERGYTSPHE